VAIWVAVVVGVFVCVNVSDCISEGVAVIVGVWFSVSVIEGVFVNVNVSG
jgi:hypothetical protein